MIETCQTSVVLILKTIHCNMMHFLVCAWAARERSVHQNIQTVSLERRENVLSTKTSRPSLLSGGRTFCPPKHPDRLSWAARERSVHRNIQTVSLEAHPSSYSVGSYVLYGKAAKASSWPLTSIYFCFSEWVENLHSPYKPSRRGPGRFYCPLYFV